jgi:isoleucyl-tRNA synthetase
VHTEGLPESVHLTAWTEVRLSDSTVSAPLLVNMKTVRAMVTAGLEARAKHNLKVRQPLNPASVSASHFKVRADAQESLWMRQIVADELNVKDVLFVEGQEELVVLDTHITPELKAEGDYRDLLRSIQELRKNTGLNPGDIAHLTAPELHKDTLDRYMADLKKAANLVDVTYVSAGDMVLVKV